MTERKTLETRYGIIDPMHNLFLQNTLGQNAIPIIQGRVDSLKLPVSCGRLPKKIGLGFAGFTAEKWENWTNIFPLYALRDQLPN